MSKLACGARTHTGPRSPDRAKPRVPAATIWRTYRRSDSSRERVVADFLIGAYSRPRASRQLTRDRGFYREQFEALRIVTSSTDGA